ncbi:hypothetical protein XENTR_v10022310 [Xenopus tropicalis]|nr:hypothetical protein XENTR_v10022310 [Xenopus tropicalis]
MFPEMPYSKASTGRRQGIHGENTVHCSTRDSFGRLNTMLLCTEMKLAKPPKRNSLGHYWYLCRNTNPCPSLCLFLRTLELCKKFCL